MSSNEGFRDNNVVENVDENPTKETIDTLEGLVLDPNIPKNIKAKIQNIIQILKEDSELPIKINKALNDLDEISNEANLEQYIRTQIWNVVSILEKINH
ncbi:MAG: UPF0147 family protein [Nanoarchaeota archaeon]|nr:UPF0147 family protein [Nanoarchaeota archaeon]